jgi:hypothetical protein
MPTAYSGGNPERSRCAPTGGDYAVEVDFSLDQ